jgi:hypothetical protein
LDPLGGAELVGAAGLAATELEGGVAVDDAVVRDVGQHGGERGLHEANGVLRETLPALVREERLDVAPVEIAEFDPAQRGKHVAVQEIGVGADRGRLLLHRDVREPAGGVRAEAGVAVGGSERAPDRLEEFRRERVRVFLGRERRAPPNAGAVAGSP